METKSGSACLAAPDSPLCGIDPIGFDSVSVLKHSLTLFRPCSDPKERAVFICYIIARCLPCSNNQTWTSRVVVVVNDTVPWTHKKTHVAIVFLNDATAVAAAAEEFTALGSIVCKYACIAEVDI